MKHSFILESPFDFEPGKYYCVIQGSTILDRFFCADLNRAALQFETYKSRGCEIWQYLTPEEAQIKWDELWKENSYYFDLFSHSKRSNASQLAKMCELRTTMNRIYKVFIEKENRIK